MFQQLQFETSQLNHSGHCVNTISTKIKQFVRKTSRWSNIFTKKKLQQALYNLFLNLLRSSQFVSKKRQSSIKLYHFIKFNRRLSSTNLRLKPKAVSRLRYQRVMALKCTRIFTTRASGIKITTRHQKITPTVNL